MDHSLRYQESRRITILGAGKNILLALLKIIFGITGHSHALFADGIHSLSDLLIDTLVLIASRFGSKAADHDHPYGHGRIETAATVLLAFILLLAGAAIIYNAAAEIFGIREAVKPSFYVLIIALFSMLINEVIFFYTKRIGEKIKSKLLIANAWHHRSDSASSLVVLIGVAAAWLGFGKFDALAAIVVGLMVIHMAWQFGLASMRELVDTGLDDDLVNEIKTIINDVPGVRALHQLRSRFVGGAIFLDVHIQVSPFISVSEGHYIGQQVHYKIIREVPDVVDVTVHVDPEDDEVVAPSRHLASREVLIDLLQQRWADLPVLAYLDNMSLHYLSGKLQIELRLPIAWLLQSSADMHQLSEQLQHALADQPQIASVKLLFVL
jgi:cation diffusion facilitator family transporter